MFKKYFSEHSYYFLAFSIISILYIVNGYASLGTNDDWALRGILTNKDIYGTLIMSYPLSYIMSHLYNFFPSIPWYSTLLASIMAINFYLISIFIEKNNSYIQKAILFVLALLWLTFIWFNTTITTITIITMISAIGLIRKNLILSFIFIFIASLLRTDMMIIFIPYYTVSYFILRNKLTINKNEVFTLLALIILLLSSIFIQKQDKLYSDWLTFNKARASIVDMDILNAKKGYFSKEERFAISTSWFQDEELLSTKKLVDITPHLGDIIHVNIKKIHLLNFLKNYKFKYWLWLLLAFSLLAIIINIKSRKAIFIPVLIIGVILLLITRDVERVTVALIMLWAYVVSQSIKKYTVLNSLFLFLFTYIFYTYSSGQLGYRYFKEVTQLKKEAHQLIKNSNKKCEVSVNYPTKPSSELHFIFKANYLFHEDNWMQLNSKEILPTGWIVRHELFYKSHDISDKYTKRKYANYHEYLVDNKTAFFGSKYLEKSMLFNILLNGYDKKYLKNRPECKHKTYMIDKSKHFGISQIGIECNGTRVVE